MELKIQNICFKKNIFISFRTCRINYILHFCKTGMELGVFLISLAGGIGLSSACGFRVFVPPLLMSLASILGILDLNGDLAWMGTIPALILFAFATVIEIGSYYIPWVDNMLDTIASPAAVIVGILVSSAVIEADSDLIRWTAAIVLGGGSIERHPQESTNKRSQVFSRL